MWSVVWKNIVIHIYNGGVIDIKLWNTACLLAYFLHAPGACPTNDILIEFEIWPKLAVLWFKIYSTAHNEILHLSWQLLS